MQDLWCAVRIGFLSLFKIDTPPGWGMVVLQAANILVKHEGHVVIGDFGVTAILTESDDDIDLSNGDSSYGPMSARPVAGVPGFPQTMSGSRRGLLRETSSGLQRYLARSTFCGTPCFMAPEVMEQTSGYGTEADMWSFGIMLVELALGRAPYANMSVTAVILTTLRDEPPTLDTIPDAEEALV
eukprot:jgi/Botrbrau1/1477/Bobra.178_3s0033.1